MSIIFKAGSEICKSITNTSTAKYQFSFPKAERFPKPREIKPDPKYEELEKKINYKHQDYYLLPSTLNNRYTRFGYGQRSDFTGGAKVSKSVSQSENKIRTEPDKSFFTGPKYSFANGREKYEKVYVESTKPLDRNIPGPAKYDILKKVTHDFGYDAPKISFGGLDPETRLKALNKKKEEQKLLMMEEKENEKKNPSYKPKVTIQIRPSGKYAVSHIPNVNSINYEKDKSKRTQFEANKNPGPSDYDKDNISLNKSLLGKIFPSKYRSHERITFTERHDVKDSRSNYPGPGSYIIPSDFGIYLSKDYNDEKKYPKDNVYVEPKKEQDPRPWRHGMKKIVKKEEGEDDNNYYNEQNNEDNQEMQENPEEENKVEEQTPTPDDNNKEGKNKEGEGEKNKEGDKKEENKNENKEGDNKDENKEGKKEEGTKDEDKESDVILLRDILTYGQ